MNLREAIEEYVMHCMRCQEVIGWEGEGVERIRRQAVEVEERLYRAVEVAEAAIAYMEQQAASVGDPVVYEAVYYRERRRLWNAFMAARAKAKDANQS